MKKRLKFFAIAAMALVCFSANAQNNANNSDKKDRNVLRQEFAAKTARAVAKELDLTTENTEKYVDTYVRCQNEIWALRGDRPEKDAAKDRPGKKHRKQAKNDRQQQKEMTDSAMRAGFDREQRMLDIRKKYYDEYLTFMTPEQIAKSYKLEKKFTQKLKSRHAKKDKDRKQNRSTKQHADRNNNAVTR